MHICFSMSLFANPTQHDILKAISGTFTEKPPTKLFKIVDCVHTHVCRHETYSDIKTTLLQRNNISSELRTISVQKQFKMYPLQRNFKASAIS